MIFMFLILGVVLGFLQSCSKIDDIPVFSGDSAYVFLVDQCKIGPRYPGSHGHRTLQRYIVEQLKKFDANVSLQPFSWVLTTGDTLHLINIIGNYKKSSRKRILLGAHYDTRPRADRDKEPSNRTKPILGANDGASGVAVLLELARIFKKSEPPVGVDLVFFDGEDYGLEGRIEDYLLGSKYFVAHRKGYSPLSAIIVDMIGDKDLEIEMETYSSQASPELVEEIFSIAEKLNVKEFVKRPGPAIIDDHVPFIQVGISAIDLIDFNYPYWHTLDDTPDKCSPASLEAVGKVIVQYIWRIED